MSADRNPQKASRRHAVEASDVIRLKGGVVTNAPSDADDAHAVQVRPDGMDRTVGCLVGVPTQGDVSVPTEGTDVVFAFRKRNPPIIVAVEYTTEASLTSTLPGERRLSHPLSDAEVYFDDSGVLHVSADDGTELTITNGEIHLGGSSDGVVTDVQAGSTNSEGGITSLNIIRSNTVKL